MYTFCESDLLDTLNELHLQYRVKGDELNLDRCPFCEKDRPNKSDHFSFNRGEGVFHCVKCNTSGNLVTFRKEMGIDPWRERGFYRPDQDTVKSYAKQPKEYHQGLSKLRGIPEEILVRYGVGKADRSDIGQCRTYQFVDTDGTVVNIKYVNFKKEMRQEVNAKRIYYGLQFLDYSKPELHITEGEDDCHALVSMGFDNVVSVPNGANSYNEEMGQINAKFKKIWLFFDNDKAGQDGAYNFAQKAGVWKCWNVFLPFKDVRDCLLHGHDIFTMQQLMGKAKQFEYSTDTKLRPAVSIQERIQRFEKEAKKNLDGIRFGFDVIDNITGGLRGGDLFSIVANPGCFKTTALMNFLKRAVEKHDNGIAIFFSLEMQIEAEFEREVLMYTNPEKRSSVYHAAAKCSEEWNYTKYNLVNGRYSRIYVSDENDLDLAGIDKVIERTEEATGEKTILIGIDYIDFINTNSKNEYESVKEIMNGCKKYIARKRNVPVIILCQTSRASKDSEEEVGERSGKGGTGIESASDFMIGLWKLENTVVGRITKHRRMMHSHVPNPYIRFKINKRNYLIDDVEMIDEKEAVKKKKTRAENSAF
jgi:KaiC/GvpD/RAD55 family RecA-like ATPase